jgi:hypothetical protein
LDLFKLDISGSLPPTVIGSRANNRYRQKRNAPERAQPHAHDGNPRSMRCIVCDEEREALDEGPVTFIRERVGSQTTVG